MLDDLILRSGPKDRVSKDGRTLMQAAPSRPHVLEDGCVAAFWFETDRCAILLTMETFARVGFRDSLRDD